MLTAKENYEELCIQERKLIASLVTLRSNIRVAKIDYQEACKHLNTRKQFWEDYHKNEYGTSIYCDDCNKYLREE